MCRRPRRGTLGCLAGLPGPPDSILNLLADLLNDPGTTASAAWRLGCYGPAAEHATAALRDPHHPPGHHAITRSLKDHPAADPWAIWI